MHRKLTPKIIDKWLPRSPVGLIKSRYISFVDYESDIDILLDITMSNKIDVDGKIEIVKNKIDKMAKKAQKHDPLMIRRLMLIYGLEQVMIEFCVCAEKEKELK